MIVLSLLALAAPPQGGCHTENQITVTGVVTSVTASPAAPLDTIAAGDSLSAWVSFATDTACGGQNATSYVVTPGCTDLTIGGTSVSIHQAIPDPCIWTETYSSAAGAPVEFVRLDAPFNAGATRFELVLEDPMGAVGIGLFDLLANDLVVGSVTAPGFAISARLLDPAGLELATIEVSAVEGTAGVSSYNYCDANPNSTGAVARMSASGSLTVQDNNLAISASGLPASTFGFFIVSPTQGFAANPGNSAGNLCLGGAIGRYVGPGQIMISDSAGTMGLDIDLTAIPTPQSLEVVEPGDTWNFQCWYRDVTGQTASNFTDGISLPFF